MAHQVYISPALRACQKGAHKQLTARRIPSSITAVRSFSVSSSTMTDKIRKEKDTFGWLDVPAHRYWGAQTQRSLINFDIGKSLVLHTSHTSARVQRSSPGWEGPGEARSVV